MFGPKDVCGSRLCMLWDGCLTLLVVRPVLRFSLGCMVGGQTARYGDALPSDHSCVMRVMPPLVRASTVSSAPRRRSRSLRRRGLCCGRSTRAAKERTRHQSGGSVSEATSARGSWVLRAFCPFKPCKHRFVPRKMRADREEEWVRYMNSS